MPPPPSSLLLLSPKSTKSGLARRGKKENKIQEVVPSRPFLFENASFDQRLVASSNELFPPSFLLLFLSLSSLLYLFLSNSLLFYLLTARLHIQRTHAHSSQHVFLFFFLVSFLFLPTQNIQSSKHASTYTRTLAEALAHVHFLLYQTIYLHLYPFKSYARR